MPPVEDSFMVDTAVLWAAGAVGIHGELAMNAPIEIDCRWSEQDGTGAGVEGGTNPMDARVEVDLDVPIGSIMWKGELADWNPSLPQRLLQVVSFSADKDVKGRWTSRRLGLRRFRGNLPLPKPT